MSDYNKWARKSVAHSIKIGAAIIGPEALEDALLKNLVDHGRDIGVAEKKIVTMIPQARAALHREIEKQFARSGGFQTLN